jgi:hypothetical protein
VTDVCSVDETRRRRLTGSPASLLIPYAAAERAARPDLTDE